MSDLDESRLMMIKHREIMDSIRITDREIDIIKYIAFSGSVKTSDIMEQFSCSIQNASISLRKLCDKGYLSRKQLTQASGGLEYEYCSRVLQSPYKAKTIGNTPAGGVGINPNINNFDMPLDLLSKYIKPNTL